MEIEMTVMLRPSLLAALSLSLLAAGCSSSRFGPTPGPVAAAPRGPAVVYNDPADAPLAPAAPTSPIRSEPLAPIGGGAPAPGTLAPTPGSGAVAAGGQVIDPSYNPPASTGPVARLEEPKPAAPTGRLAAVGSWRAKDATGGTCRVQLSSAPALDLYKASASGCANKDLARLTAWDNRDGEIYLYQAGGTVLARLRPGGEGYEGLLTKSSASISLGK